MPRAVIKNRIKAKVWGARSTMEIDGGFDVIPHMMYYIDSAKKRQQILAQMFEVHQSMLEIEAQQDKENARQEEN